MTIYYQWISGAYSNIASINIQKKLWFNDSQIVGLPTFREVWEYIDDESIAVLPIENSYAGSIHENIYGFLKNEYTVITDYYLPIDHCLLANTKELKNIQKAYSHPQALAQCQDFLQQHNIQPIPYADTAKSSEFVAQSWDKSIASIASSLAGELYKLHTVTQWIQDQKWNTTRFIVVANKHCNDKILSEKKISLNKTIIIFQTEHIPAVLYKCLWAFATNNINLTKLESIPAYQDPFSYNFWIECDSILNTNAMSNALQELKFFTKFVRVLTK